MRLNYVIFLAFFLFAAGTVQAQVAAEASDELAAADTLAPGWYRSAVAGLGLTQAAYENWAGGGENTTAFKTQFDYGALRKGEKTRQIHTLQFAFGQSKIGDVDFRKVDDLLRYSLELIYDRPGALKPVVVVDARTQIASGFNYGGDEPDGILVSKFLAPGYLTETVGVVFEPASWIRARAGIAGKQTIVADADLRNPEDPSFPIVNGYGNDPDQSLRAEFGSEVVLLGAREVYENVFLKSELGVFNSFSDFGNPDIRWKNLLSFAINQYMNATFELELFQDKDQSEDLQVRQVLALGLTYTLL